MSRASTNGSNYFTLTSSFGIISEMRDPRLYHRAMIINQVFVTCMYVIIGSIVYWYAGKYVAQPALGTAGPLMKKICYGLSIPGLFFSVILWCHVSDKGLLTGQKGHVADISRSRPSSSWSASCAARSTLPRARSCTG